MPLRDKAGLERCHSTSASSSFARICINQSNTGIWLHVLGKCIHLTSFSRGSFAWEAPDRWWLLSCLTSSSRYKVSKQLHEIMALVNGIWTVLSLSCRIPLVGEKWNKWDSIDCCQLEVLIYPAQTWPCNPTVAPDSLLPLHSAGPTYPIKFE